MMLVFVCAGMNTAAQRAVAAAMACAGLERALQRELFQHLQTRSVPSVRVVSVGGMLLAKQC